MKIKIKRVVATILALATMIGTMPDMNMAAYAADSETNTEISSALSEAGLTADVTTSVSASAESVLVKTSGETNDFTIVDSSQTATLWVDSSEETPVSRVVTDFQADVNRVTGKTPTISNSSTLPSGPVVIIGTLNKSAQIKKLISAGKISSSEVNAISGQWEAYLIKVIDKNTMVIVGSDNRGAIYGTYEISEQMGVSPWYYFADVPIQTKSSVYMPAGTSITDMPDVKYRGIFINDEEKLRNWVVNKFNPENGGSGNIGAAAYAKIFELILRLKGNYLWPAMHGNAFDTISENITTIDNYGVVMRKTISAGDEWSTFKKKYASEKGIDASTLSYDYTVNPEAIQAFWRDSISSHKNSEVQWMLGMRGEGDEPFNTANLSDSKYDKYGTDTESRKAGLLSEIIADQIKVLGEEIGTENASKASKAILPYKEVLQLYNNENFTMPEGVTVIWCDDNHGMVRKTPTSQDRAKGDGGIYMHASYWAPANQSYMWMSSISLSVMGEELKKCWDTGIQSCWVLNVGDIKPLEGEMDYFIRCGWDVDKYTTDAKAFEQEWMARNFGDSMSEETQNEVADIMDGFYHISNIRKTEQMSCDVFEQINYNEWDTRMATIQDLYDRTRAVANSMTTAQKTGFYELIQCKINWFYYTNKMFYYADKSNLDYDQGRMASAQNFSDLSIKVETQRKTEIAYYGKIADGKWEGLIDPETYSPPVTSQLAATNPTLVLGESEMGVIVQGEEMPIDKTSTLSFNIYGQDGKFIDVFNKGAGKVTFTASVDESWVTLSAKSGTFNDEKRIWVTVNDYDKAAGKSAVITITSGDVTKKIVVSVEKVQSGISNAYVESDGYVSMKAYHYTDKTSAGTKSWNNVKDAGRVDGDMMQALDTDGGMVDADNISASTSPCLTYDFYLTSEGSFPMEIYRLPTMNAVTNGQLRFAVSVDDGSPIIVSSTATDEGTTSNQNKQWVKNIFGMIEKHVVTLPELSSGRHTLKIWMVDNYITIDKMVIYTTGSVTESATGPEESYHSQYNNTFKSSVPQISRTSAELSEKNLMASWGSGAFVESAGVVGIEAEYAMENVLSSKSEVTSDMNAYTISKKQSAIDSGKVANEWRLTQSDTGLAMRTPDKGSGWSDSTFVSYAPELSYKINFSTTGTYNVWVRWRYVDNASDSIRGGLDNTFVSSYFTGGGGYYSDKKDEKWNWQQVASIPVSTAGEHIISLWEREDGLSIDKIYLTTGTETPTDTSFAASSRADTATKTSFVQSVSDAKTEAANVSYPLGSTLGCYGIAEYNSYIEAIEAAEKLTCSGSLTAQTATNALTKISTAKQALLDSQVLTDNYITYNAYRNFEDDTVGAYPFGFEKQALTDGASVTVEEEDGNKYLSVTTGTTAAKANIVLPYSGTVAPASGQKVVIEFSARFTGTFNYANGAMVKNDVDKYAMVAAFDNANQSRAIKIQNGSTKTTVANFVSGQWYNFKLVGDMAEGKYTAYIDGVEVATDYTFRDATGTKLTGQLFGIDGFANGRVDYDNFRVRVLSSTTYADARNEIAVIATALKSDMAKYSYPLGDTAGCYSKEKYDALLQVISDAETASASSVSYDGETQILNNLTQARKNFDNSLVLSSGNSKTYNAYRNFENDTVGELLPYGIKSTTDNGGTTEIVEEAGNKFLRLKTGTTAGKVNMILPYLEADKDQTGTYSQGIKAQADEKIVVEYMARFNEDLRYANACIAKNQTDSAATTMAFDNASSARRVILKKSSSGTTVANFEYDTWHSYKLVIDMEDKTYDVYMDGKLISDDFAFRTTDSRELIAHGFGIDGFANGQLDFDNIKVSIVSDLDKAVETSEDLEINGYQISATAKGLRTIYSVAGTVEGKAVEESGMIYSLAEYADDSELYVGSDNTYVKNYKSTEAGKLDSDKFDTGISSLSGASSYAMTVLFATSNPIEYTTTWRIRAYAKLSDGTYAYSDSYEYTIFKVADRMYQNYYMPSSMKHDYLYTDILSLVDSSYVKKTYKWSKSVVAAE